MKIVRSLLIVVVELLISHRLGRRMRRRLTVGKALIVIAVAISLSGNFLLGKGWLSSHRENEILARRNMVIKSNNDELLAVNKHLSEVNDQLMKTQLEYIANNGKMNTNTIEAEQKLAVLNEKETKEVTELEQIEKNAHETIN